jgi:3-methyladenine DNA glycosylase AlkD
MSDDAEVTPEAALAALEAASSPGRAAEMAAYHKAPRRYLGLALPAMEPLVARWRSGLDVPGRVALARGLWDSDVHEARIAAAKLLTQARIPDSEPLVWEEFLRWVPDFDAWAIADHACKAGERRLTARPERLDVVEGWTRDPNMWVRRAALVATLPWARLNHPASDDRAARERILGWAAGYVPDRDWFIQKAIGWWLRTLSVRDPARVRAFLDGPGRELKPFARREALRRVPDPGR